MVSNNLSEGIAFQIAATRDARGMTQAQLAEKLGGANNLPRLEDPEYGSHTIKTLKKVASALDVALVVRFVPFSQYIDWLSGTPYWDDGMRPEALAVPSFEDEEDAILADEIMHNFQILPLISGGTYEIDLTPPTLNSFWEPSTPPVFLTANMTYAIAQQREAA